MPINPNALSSPEPDEQPPSEAAAASLAGVTNENEDPSAQVTDQASHDVPGEPAKRTRRTKAQMIADDVPAPAWPFEVKDSGTGATVTRPWAEAVELVKADAAEFVDKSLKYAVL